MEHASTIDIGARKERQNRINEDAIATAVFENHHRQSSRSVGVFVLCDGVGGEASGDVASFLATTVIRKRLTDALLGPGTDLPERFGVDLSEGTPPTATDSSSATTDSSSPSATEARDGDENRRSPDVGESSDAILSEDGIRSAVEAAINAAHRRIQAYAEETDGRPATTAVVCVSVDGRLHYGWVGDSRAYLVNARHRTIQQLTKDHAATNRLLEAGEIDDEVYARVHEDTTAITRALGGSPYGEPTVDVDFDSVELFEDDVLLVTSDGLVDAFPDIAPLRKRYERATDEEAVRAEIRDRLVTDDEIRDVVLDAANLRDGVEELVDFANDRGGKDNLSVTLARDPDAAPSPATLPARGIGTEPPTSLTARETVVEPSGSVESVAEPEEGKSDAESEDGEPVAESEDADQRSDRPEASGVPETEEGASKKFLASDKYSIEMSSDPKGIQTGTTVSGADSEVVPSDEDAPPADAEASSSESADAGAEKRGRDSTAEIDPDADADKEDRDGDQEAVRDDATETDRDDETNRYDADVETDGDGDETPTAALVIAGHGNVYELEDGFTIGRGEVEGSDNPNVGLVVNDEADIETHHARFEYDEGGDWRVRDISTSGTFVQNDDGDWRYLLSGEGVERSRKRGFDPESDADGVPNVASQLRDGTAISLHHPHDRHSVTLRFFASAERAERRTNAGGGDDPTSQ